MIGTHSESLAGQGAGYSPEEPRIAPDGERLGPSATAGYYSLTYRIRVCHVKTGTTPRI